MASRHFRAGVVTVVTRSDGQVLAFERADVPDSWQLPQGGLEKGEWPLEAAWRELREETGLGPDEVELVEEYPEWILYEWPIDAVGEGARLGQVHRWFFFRVRSDDVEPEPDGHEFRDWRWVETPWLVENVVPFRQPGYRRIFAGDRNAVTPR